MYKWHALILSGFFILLTQFLKVNWQLLDEVFVIFRIINVEVRVISLSLRLRLIALTETLIILDITKTESNNCFIIHWTKQKKTSLCFFTDGKKNKASELDMTYTTWLLVTLTWLPVTLTWLLNNLQLWRHRRGFSKINCTLSANQKRGSEFNV